jgi:SAM-dependent methyltransferase
MTTATSAIRLTGTATVVRFNWPKYLGVLALVAAAGAADLAGAPRPARALSWLVCVPAVTWTVASLAATWWVYDHRRVYELLTAGLGDAGDWAVVHAGFDESLPALRNAIGRPPTAVAEITIRPGPTLRRARGRNRHPVAGVPVDDLSLGAGSLDSVFVTFAAHEVRDLDEQRALFRSLRQTLRPDGRLIITEHPRDAANLAVYGPGALHFQPLATWHARAAEAGLSAQSRLRITAFVERVVYRR